MGWVWVGSWKIDPRTTLRYMYREAVLCRTTWAIGVLISVSVAVRLHALWDHGYSAIVHRVVCCPELETGQTDLTRNPTRPGYLTRMNSHSSFTSNIAATLVVKVLVTEDAPSALPLSHDVISAVLGWGRLWMAARFRRPWRFNWCQGRTNWDTISTCLFNANRRLFIALWL